jgi:glutamate carboxypeptidase
LDYAVMIDTYVKEHRAEMLASYETIVNMEDHFLEKGNVEAVRDWVRQQFEQEGFRCWTQEVCDDRAGILVGMLGEDRPGKPVLFSGHLDTVFHAGTFAGLKPFRVEGNTVYGPGVQDMKGGVIIALYAVKALRAIGWQERPLKILFVGEEESDHIGNHADDFITDQSRDILCAFNMEGGNMHNDLCTGRKSLMTCHVQVTGVGGHAGIDFLTGKNAIDEMVYKLYEIIGLTDLEKGTTVTPSTIKGGLNVCGIPETCEATIDFRIDSRAERSRILSELDRILSHCSIVGTHTTYHLDEARFQPYTETAAISGLHSQLCDAALSLGLPPFGKEHSGGAADSGNIARAGVPVLCCCGVMGAFSHSLKEYAVLSSLYDRTKVLALAIAQLNTDKFI